MFRSTAELPWCNTCYYIVHHVNCMGIHSIVKGSKKAAAILWYTQVSDSSSSSFVQLQVCASLRGWVCLSLTQLYGGSAARCTSSALEKWMGLILIAVCLKVHLPHF